MLNDTLTMYINGAIRSRCYYENKKCEAIIKCRILLLDGGWTTKSPADGNKSLVTPQKYLLKRSCHHLSRQGPERMAKEPNTQVLTTQVEII